ncbi:MAG: phage tail protein [Wolinella sp.]
MILNLGGFSFMIVDGLNLESEFGINKSEVVQNHALLFRANLGGESVNLEAHTLPLHGDKQSALKALYELAQKGESYTLVSGYGRYFGRFAIAKISEKQEIFTNDGRFFKQSFSLELIRDYEV